MKNLFETIKDIALLHQSVNQFESGDIFKLNDLKDINYPLIWMELQTTDLKYTKINPTIRLFYVDRTLDDLSDSTQIELDSNQILNDILNTISTYYQILSISSVTPFNQKFNDMCAGAYLDTQLSECSDGVGITEDIVADEPNLLPSQYVSYSGDTLKNFLDNLTTVTTVTTDNQTIEGDGTATSPLYVSDNITTVQPLELTGSTTLSLDMQYKGLIFNSSSGINCIIPLNSNVEFKIGTIITIQQYNTGIVTVSGEVGVTINGYKSTSGQFKFIQIWKVSENEWNVIGGVE